MKRLSNFQDSILHQSLDINESINYKFKPPKSSRKPLQLKKVLGFNDNKLNYSSERRFQTIKSGQFDGIVKYSFDNRTQNFKERKLSELH